MLLKVIRLGKSISGQQFSKECIGCSTIFEVGDSVATRGITLICYVPNHKKKFKSMPHLPLLVILLNFVKRVLNHVPKNHLLQIYKRARKHVQIE